MSTATHWPASLSPFQRRAVALLASTGGAAYPERGGWWRSEPAGGGVRLIVDPEVASVAGSVTVQTLRALERRGLVSRVPNPDPATRYHPGYRLTAQGRQAAGAGVEPISATASAQREA